MSRQRQSRRQPPILPSGSVVVYTKEPIYATVTRLGTTYQLSSAEVYDNGAVEAIYRRV